MSEFHFQLGRNDAKAGRHFVPIGLSGQALRDWQEGHGAGWRARPVSPAKEPASSLTENSRSAAPAASGVARPTQLAASYAPFSTPATKRRAKTARAARSLKSSSNPHSPSVNGSSFKNSHRPSPSVTPRKPVEMGLFGPIEVDTSEKTPRAKAPAPIPNVDRDAERDRLVRIGIGFSDAVQLVEADWTLDQLECRWQLNDWSDQPKFVQEVAALVAAHCEQQWPR